MYYESILYNAFWSIDIMILPWNAHLLWFLKVQSILKAIVLKATSVTFTGYWQTSETITKDNLKW